MSLVSLFISLFMVLDLLLSCPSICFYVTGQCILLLETNQTTIFGHRLNIGDVYGDESLQSQTHHHLNGLMTHEMNHCNLLGFFSRDIKVNSQ